MTSTITTSSTTKMKSGERHNRLTAVARVEVNKHGKAIWSFLCSCGNEHKATACSVRSGNTKSCGCQNIEALAARNKTYGASDSSEYNTWCAMIGRCTNPNNHAFDYYGGRGITVCDLWRQSFEAFYADMGPKPTPKHTIERMENNGSYCKENCKWATRSEQARNRRSIRTIIVNGKTMSLAEAVERSGLIYITVWRRLQLGWSTERAISVPARSAR